MKNNTTLIKKMNQLYRGQGSAYLKFQADGSDAGIYMRGGEIIGFHHQNSNSDLTLTELTKRPISRLEEAIYGNEPLQRVEGSTEMLLFQMAVNLDELITELNLQSEEQVVKVDVKQTQTVRLIFSDHLVLEDAYLLNMGNTLVGRGVDCDIVLVDPLISREHAQIQIDNTGAWVSDLQSSNGTLLNDLKVHDRMELQSGDVLKFGNLSFKYCLTAQNVGVLMTIVQPEDSATCIIPDK